MYGKILRRRTVCHVHDEANASHIGDTVEIEESPPLSKLKRWVAEARRDQGQANRRRIVGRRRRNSGTIQPKHQ